MSGVYAFANMPFASVVAFPITKEFPFGSIVVRVTVTPCAFAGFGPC